MWTSSSSPSSRAIASRNAIISRNFQVVSTCSSGNGGLAGIEGLHRQVQHHRRCPCRSNRASPGCSHSATTSRMMWMLSASRRCRCVSRIIVASQKRAVSARVPQPNPTECAEYKQARRKLTEFQIHKVTLAYTSLPRPQQANFRLMEADLSSGATPDPGAESLRTAAV